MIYGFKVIFRKGSLIQNRAGLMLKKIKRILLINDSWFCMLPHWKSQVDHRMNRSTAGRGTKNMADAGRRGACGNKKSDMEECQHQGLTCKAKREAHGAGQIEELPRKALT